MTEPTRPCGTCGMPCTPGEYHPYAACLMFKACHNSETVRANLEAVRGTPPVVAGEPVGEFDQMRGRLVILDGAPMFKHRQKVYATPQPTQAPAVAGEPVAWLSTDSIGERYLCFTKPNDSDPARPLVFGDTTTQAQAGAVPMYRLLQSGVDRIEAADEFLSDDTTTWAIDQNGIFSGNIYGGHVLRPARRRIKGGQHGAE